MKSRIIITLIVLLTGIIGCANNKQWVKDVSQDQVSRDNGECKLEAQKATQFALGQSPLIQSINFSNAVDNCYQSKGYTLQQKPSAAQQKMRQDIEARYKNAGETFQTKAKPLQDFVINECRPKENVEYVKCIRSVKPQWIDISVFPDIQQQQFNERVEFEEQLLRKEITRKEFREATDGIDKRYEVLVLERINNDIKNGTYSGKY